MRKYVLTDRAGVTITGHTLAPGKFIQSARDKASIMPRISECGADTPLLAALLSPIPSDQARLFSIHCWSVTIDPKNAQSYTVVKELENVPAVAATQRLHFAILVTMETFRDREFRHWAERWLSGTDTSAASTHALLDNLEKEADAATGLAEIGAWAEAGADSDLGPHRDQGLQRARHVLRAAEMLESPERASSAAMEITQALAGLDQLSAAVPLVAMSELATSTPSWQQAAG